MFLTDCGDLTLSTQDPSEDVNATSPGVFTVLVSRKTMSIIPDLPGMS